MQYPNINEIFFPNWKIISFDVDNNKIHHNVSTYNGSSDSLIIRRWEDNYIIGLHFVVDMPKMKINIYII